MNNKIKKITILGDGGWGTTLAIHLAKKGYPVKIWGPFPEYLQCLRKDRINKKFLPDIKIPESIIFSDDLTQAIEDSQLIIIAIPSKYAPGIIRQLKGKDISQKTILSVIKGIDTKTLKTMSELIHQELGTVRLAILSGPTIAIEVAKGLPATAVIASKNLKVAQELQKIFNSDRFRIYTNSDTIGVELGGSVKNVIAIAAGICDGIGLGTNAKAALLSRGLAEIIRLGKAMGAKEKTFAGLSGLGDLTTTCFSHDSRNRSVGEQLGRGQTIHDITSHMDMVAEGVTTVQAIHRLSQKYKVPMPITQEVYNIIYKNKDPQKAVSDLMQRKLKME